ncbi:uncharacterized protein BDV17DRAFT_295084 [Aspergillus undulatus]|uniref:uncharacterized protein n=1 Tax=Aspergillus undulatus TaxID=1810928 RepID=UPI003CCDB0D5
MWKKGLHSEGRNRNFYRNPKTKSTDVDAGINGLTDNLNTLKVSGSLEVSKTTARTSIKISVKPNVNATKTGTGPIIIETATGVAEMVNDLENLPNDRPSLYVDLEGIDLCRHGSISIMQIYHLPQKKVYLLDVHKLNKMAFLAPGLKACTTTLKSVLENPSIQKLFFDVRNDSDALYAHFGVHPSGGLRQRPRKCIDRDAGLSFDERIKSHAIKEKGRKLFPLNEADPMGFSMRGH